MATGGGERPPDDLDFRHSCSLCLEPYMGRNPKILSCFHTFCLPCLTTLQANVTIKTPIPEGQGQENDETNDGDVTCGNDAALPPNGVFLCPTCRAFIPIPDGGMSKPQDNLYVFDDDREPPTVASMCDVCDVTNQQEATHECRHCRKRMCNGCRRCHDTFMPEHQVVPVRLGNPPGRESNTPRHNCCLIHQDQPLCFFCRQCDVTICLHCNVTSHEGHVTVDLARAILESRDEMTSLLTSAQEQLQVTESALRRLDRDDRELTRYTQQVTQQVHARHDALMTWVLQSRDQLLDDVIAEEEEVKGQLRAEKTAVSITMETLTSLVSRAARTSSNDPDVLLLKKEIQAALHGEDRLSHLRKLADRHESAWRWRYDVTDADVLPPELVAAYMGHVVEGTDDDVMRMTPLSLREVSDRVDRWITDVTETTAMLKKADDDLQAKTTSLDNDVTAMKKTEADLQAKTSSLDNDVTAMKKTEADMQAKSTSLENAQKKTEADLQAKTTSLDNDVTAMKQKEADLQTDVTSLKTTAKTLSDKFENAGKLFCAEYPDKEKTKQDQAIIYNNVTHNVNNCFDAASSKFKAPHTGLYVFLLHLETRGGLSTYFKPTAHLMVNDNSHFFASEKSRSVFEGDWDGKKFSLSIELSQGDTVWLKAGSPGDHYYSTCDFSGYLIHRL